MGSRWVANLEFTPAPERAVRGGLLGWLRFDLDGMLHLDGVALRRTRGGRLALSFPVRVDGRGVARALVRPLDDRARREIEAAVLAELGSEVAP